MAYYTIAFAGSGVSIDYDTEEAETFLRLLFADLPTAASDASEMGSLALLRDADQDTYSFFVHGELLFNGRLRVACAAVVYDRVIYHLLDNARSGIALHAGAVAYRGKTILLPGRSGSGKSTLTAWLSTRGCSYLTGELVFIPEDHRQPPLFFSRPICLKAGAVAVIKDIVENDITPDLMEDSQGAIIPHRLLNPDFSSIHSGPRLLLLPSYRPGSTITIETVSPAHLCTVLMTCLANARNLEGHGFPQIVGLARSVSAYRVGYGSFDELAEPLSALLQI